MLSQCFRATVTASVLFVGLNARAHADTLIDYQISGPSQGFGTSLSGTFTYDASTQQVVDEDIFYGAGQAAGSSDEFTTSMLTSSNSTALYAQDTSSTNESLFVSFANDLGLDALDPVSRFGIGIPNGQTSIGASNLNATPTSLAPEPGTLPLLGSAVLLGANWMRSRTRRRGCEPSSQS